MAMSDKVAMSDSNSATVIRGGGSQESVKTKGIYIFKCFDKKGKLKWEDTIENVVPASGKNFILETVLAGSTYSVTGPYIGLISTTGYTSGPGTADTMSAHGGWAEGGATNNPTYTAPRPTLVFNAASAGTKAATAASFAITSVGTAKGSFVACSAAATSTIDSTSGMLLSAGTFTGGDKVVATGDTLQVTYSLGLT